MYYSCIVYLEQLIFPVYFVLWSSKKTVQVFLVGSMLRIVIEICVIYIKLHALFAINCLRYRFMNLQIAFTVIIISFYRFSLCRRVFIRLSCTV